MSEWLLSVGLDVGTTTTQLIVSQLQVENRSSGFTVPEMVIADRAVRYCSPVYFTPLQGENLVDGAGIREIVEREYARAGITRKDVDTGAVIITGETSRKENAGRVLAALSDFAGDFVVATAGPELESVLAAKGAGTLAYSDKTGETVLHMDIGGGTSNLALIREGRIVAATCLNIGGRLLKFDENGIVRYVSPVLSGLTTLQVGEKAPLHQVEQLADTLVQGLEMAAGLRPANSLLEKLMTGEVFPFPEVWRIAWNRRFHGWNSEIWGRCWERRFERVCFAGENTGWEPKPFGLPLSVPAATAPSFPAARCFIKM